MGTLDKYLDQVKGYFRVGEDESFPWSETNKTVWYALIVQEEDKLVRYGFTSAKVQKANLCAALREIENPSNALLLGVWTGSHSTHLFVLDINTAIKKLEDLD